MAPQTQKKVKYGGRTYYYKNITQLSKKIFGKSTVTTKNQARKILVDIAQGNTKRYVINKTTREVSKFDIRQKPLIMRDFGVQRTPKKKIIQDNATIGNLQLLNRLTPNTIIRVRVFVQVDVKFSEDYIQKKWTTDYQGLASNLKENVKQKTMEHYSDGLRFKNWSYRIKSTMSDKTFDIEDMILRDEKPPKIDNLFNEVITNDKWKHCIKDAMASLYPGYSKKNFKNMNTTKDIYEWCKEKDIKMTAYNIKGKMIKQHLPTGKSKRKNISFIAHNNHLYLLKNSTLSKYKPTKIEEKRVENCHEKFIEIFKGGNTPSHISYRYDRITAFIHNNVRYFENEDYEVCKKLLNHYGLIDKLNYTTSLKNVGDIIKTLYIKENIDCVIPDTQRFNIGGFVYNKYDYSDEKVEENMITIDKNLCYSHSLSVLPFGLKVDFRYTKFTKNPTEIKEDCFYIVSVQKSSLFLPNKENICSGLHLLECKKQNLKFDLLEEIQCEKFDNYYKKMITDLFNLVNDKILSRNQVKDIINVMIGKMECATGVSYYDIVEGIYNNDSKETESGYYSNIDGLENYYFLMDQKTKVKISNEKLLNIMIKEQSRRTLFEMMEKLKLGNDDIIQIKTDSITFKEKKLKLDKFINQNLDGWKFENYNRIYGTVGLDKLSFECESHNSKSNILGNCYAGCGKTYKILNQLYDDSTLVVTPAHACLVDYKKAQKNCNVIQKYQFNPHLIPKQDTIVCDEFGMVGKGGHDFLYKMFLLDKRIIAYGDYKQLKPIDGHIYNSPLYIKYMFGNIDNMTTNYRNKFSKEYYDKLINSNDKKYLSTEIKKYNTEWDKADTIICYRNKTVNRYNKLMCDKLNIKYITGENIRIDIDNIKKGTKVICKSNKVKDFYNNFSYTIKKVESDNVILYDGLNDMKINKELLVSNFNFNYARTCHSVQGQTLKSFHYPSEDLYFIDGRLTYTLISRLKF